MNKKNQWRIKSIEEIKKVKRKRTFVSKKKAGNLKRNSEGAKRPAIKHLASGVVKGGLTVLISVLIIFAIVRAGSLTPSTSPAATSYTLSNIYNRLNTNTSSTEANHLFSPSDSPAGTFYTLTEIYNKIPTIAANTVKLGTSYLGKAGSLIPSGGDASPANVLSDKTFFGGSQADWNTQTGAMASVGQQIITPSTSNLTITAGYHNGTGYCLGDADLTVNNIKKSVDLFGVAGTYSGYPGTGWVANGSGNGSTALTQASCGAAYLADNYRWQWFEDGNGDGDTTDPEDGVCVLMCADAGCTNTANYSNHGIISANWGGTETTDNTYIAEYTCSGNFPSGVVVPGATYPPAGICALCVADCYDGKKDLPDQGTYTAPDVTCTVVDPLYEECYEGPITSEVLKNWKGTRLPTSNDFFGFCGNGTATVATGRYGAQVGRTDEYLNTADNSVYEWLSEQHSYGNARISGSNACSNFGSDGVNDGNRFRAVFRP